jgi:putative heme-binding domain-containing protein
LQSILEPNREVAPQYFPTQLGLADGTTFVGILLRSSEVETYREITGKEKTFRKKEILSHEELKISLMPPGLALTLTDAELRDLLALLTNKH